MRPMLIWDWDAAIVPAIPSRTLVSKPSTSISPVLGYECRAAYLLQLQGRRPLCPTLSSFKASLARVRERN